MNVAILVAAVCTMRVSAFRDRQEMMRRRCRLIASTAIYSPLVPF